MSNVSSAWAYDDPWTDQPLLTPLEATPITPSPRPGSTSRPRGSPEPLALNGVPFPGTWALLAACRGLDPNLFLPHRGEDQSEQLRVCGACPVQIPCREYALPISGLQGIWGGLNERQRRRARRELEGEEAV